jgi:hypothetical protein
MLVILMLVPGGVILVQEQFQIQRSLLLRPASLRVAARPGLRHSTTAVSAIRAKCHAASRARDSTQLHKETLMERKYQGAHGWKAQSLFSLFRWNRADYFSGWSIS